ncbi:hypothetical protein [uncultured Pseudoteredinibacter sp.]|uniref:hypothetical protein n=1 Tax=uncultured Pseudoteredinibacter sp. TaxID=1641701 RepID=UPI002635D066|nr:hypothetical protein [uncultured Pseudoteredinibacter sp.]
MSKLFKVKERLTLEEAASHITTALGETVTLADLFRFALDGHLTLSVDFMNKANARAGKWVKTKDIEFETIEINILTGEKLDEPYEIPSKHELYVSDDNWVALESSVISISGVWDLPMIGAERLDVEHEYQQLTSGIAVTLVGIDGTFVQQGDIICQLKTDYDNNEYQEGSKAQQEGLESFIATSKLSDEKIRALREKFNSTREQYLKSRLDSPRDNHFYPSGGLGEHDYTYVLRTHEVARFIQSLGVPSEPPKPMNSKERNSLLVLIAALCKNADIDPTLRGVTTSLVAMTENLGAPLSDDTIRKILSQLEEAVSARQN